MSRFPKHLLASVIFSSYISIYTPTVLLTPLSPPFFSPFLFIQIHHLGIGFLCFATTGGVVESWMDSSMEEVCPTEDAILALLDFLVDPLLPSKSFFSREALSPSQEESVAKQVHAVVLLYNYYHKKQYPGLEFLEFESFCKMAVALKPSLLPYLRLMQKAENIKEDGVDEEVSLTEKAIMHACDVCKNLDASQHKPVIDGWPVARVAIFLVDDKKENCYLFHSSITQGVWSAIEKDVNAPNQSSEAVIQSRSGDKKKRVVKRAPKENQILNETSLQQLAYTSVKEACGINQGDLIILEKHVVYSIGKEKTAVRLYIMQCTLAHQDMNLVPINDALESLQGPLVRQESGSWIATPVVEYFHLLPFVDKVSDWLSREGLLNTSGSSEVQKEAKNCNTSQLDVELHPFTSSNFDAANRVEIPNSHLKVKPLLNISQPVDVAMEFGNGSCELEGKPLPSSSLHAEIVKELEDKDSFDLKEEQLENTSEPFAEAIEARNGSCQLKDEPCQLKGEPLSDSPPHTETAKEVEDDNSSHLKEGPPMEISQPFDVQKESTNGSSQLKEERLLHKCLHSKTTKEVEDHNISCRKGKFSQTVVYTKRKRSQRNCNSNRSPGSKKGNATTENSGQGDRDWVVTVSSNNTDIDEAVTTCSLVDGKSKSFPGEHYADNQRQMIVVEEIDQTALAGAAIVVAEVDDSLPISYKHNVERVSFDNKKSDTAMFIPDEEQDHTLVSSDSDLERLHRMQLTIASKEASLSETALKVLFKKRERLSQQLHCISDDIALCERSIQTILNGGEDNLAAKLDALIEGCNNTCLRSAPQIEDRTDLQITHWGLPPVTKRKRLSEANLDVYSPCQELDQICNVNCWMLPTYNVAASEGGFQASVTMKGPDFECSSEGSICAVSHEARNSAASNLLAKLRSMAAES